MKPYEIPTMESCMTLKPVSICSNDTLEKAVGLMFKHGIRHLPVVDGDQLVGILSDRDIGQCGGTGRNEPRIYGDVDLLQPVSEVMSSPPISARRETSIHEAIKQLVQNRIGALPVIDSDNKLIGIFTETDGLEYCLLLIERY
ncbi:MAG TPA: CBS domain-containing protein [Candidatus Manganitrophaceae bacterium]|nr:CBS domain-containing protein [Candidatus Manganitrophaceae bacterium]